MNVSPSLFGEQKLIEVEGLEGMNDAFLADGLLAAAEAFGYRLPELHGGEGRGDAPVPVPYPASCRPQAWAAASAVAVLAAVLGLEPAVLGGHAAPRPLRDAAGAPVLGAVAVLGEVVALSVMARG